MNHRSRLLGILRRETQHSGNRSQAERRRLGMSLTYQPFAQVPALNTLGQELKHNVNDLERYGSVAAAVGLVSGAVVSHGLGRLFLLGVAGALAYRGLTGHCHLYERLGVSTRSPAMEEGSQAVHIGHDPSHGQSAYQATT